MCIYIAGQGSGLTARELGSAVGEEAHSLTEGNMPSTTMFSYLPTRRHVQSGYTYPLQLAEYGIGDNTGARGQGTPHNNMQPSIGVLAIIRY